MISGGHKVHRYNQHITFSLKQQKADKIKNSLVLKPLSENRKKDLRFFGRGLGRGYPRDSLNPKCLSLSGLVLCPFGTAWSKLVSCQ